MSQKNTEVILLSSVESVGANRFYSPHNSLFVK